MMQRIREFSQGILAWTLVILIGFSFSLWGIHSYITSSAVNETVARVNGMDITQRQLQLAYERFHTQQANPSLEKKLKQQILDQLISQQVLLQSAFSQGLRITFEQLNQIIQTIPAFQSEGKFSPERFRDAMNSAGMSEQEFVRDLHSALLVNQVHTGVTMSAFALPAEVLRDFALTQQKRDIAYVVLSKDQYLKNITPTAAEIKSYYEQHASEFKMPEKVSIEYITLALPEIKKETTVSSSEVKQYYEEKINSFTHPARVHLATLLIRIPKEASADQIASAQAKVNTLYARIQKGENFEALVRANSEDPLSKDQGGDLGWLVAGTFDPTLEKIAMNLPSGGVSEPIRTKYGFNLVKLIALQKASQDSFEKVSDQIKPILLDQKAQQRYADLSEQLTNLTYANPNSLSPAAKALHLKIESTPLFTRAGGGDAITSSQKVLQAAFNPVVAEQNNNSDLIDIDTNHAVILRAKRYFPEAIKPLSEVSSQIAEHLKQRAAKEQALEAAQTIAQEVSEGKGTVKENVMRTDKTINPVVLAQAFELSPPSASHPQPRVVFSLPNGDAAVVTLLKIHELPKAMADQERALYAEQLVHRMGEMDYDRYVAGLFKKAKIKINQPS